MTLYIAGVRVEKVKACSLLHTRSTQYERKTVYQSCKTLPTNGNLSLRA